jgi:SH3-like domain-containing protein
MTRVLYRALNFLPIFLVLAVSQAAAQRMVSISRDDVNMRSGAGTQHPATWVLGRGYPLKVIGSTGSWLKVVDFENDKGWVHRPLTDRTPHHVVKVKIANMRSGPSTGSKIIAKLAYGDVLKTLKHSGSWVKLQREGGLRGWVARRLLWGW